MVVQNTGQVDARLDTARVIFQNNHSFTGIPAFPITIAGGVIDSFDFEITINQFASLGFDPIRGSVDYTNLRSLAGDIYTFTHLGFTLHPGVQSVFDQSEFGVDRSILCEQESDRHPDPGQDHQWRSINRAH